MFGSGFVSERNLGVCSCYSLSQSDRKCSRKCTYSLRKYSNLYKSSSMFLNLHIYVQKFASTNFTLLLDVSEMLYSHIKTEKLPPISKYMLF